MIGVSSSSRSFAALGAYLVAGRSGAETDRVAWSVGRNLPTDDPVLAARIMEATASQNVRVDKPVYHLVLSFDPSDGVDRSAMERVADRVLDQLKLRDHEVLIVAHRDREHQHVHLLVNRVHPETRHAWSRWRDQVIVQQVLREEERALGLREVRGRLAPAAERMTEPGRADDHPSLLPSQRDVSRGGVNVPPWAPAVEAVARDLRAYERLTEVAGEQYRAGLDASAARARSASLDAAADRVRHTEEAFGRALATVYRDPETARRAFAEVAAERGPDHALRVLRDTPERLGDLVTVVERRAFGLVEERHSASARAAAGHAAVRGAEVAAAERALAAAVLEARARRLEETFREELGALYRDPERARAAFVQNALDRGPVRAAAALREEPETFGELRTIHGRPTEGRPPDATLRERAAAAGLASVRARFDVPRDREFGRPAQHSSVELAAVVAAERPASRAHADGVARRERDAHAVSHQLPDRAELERRIAQGLSALAPRELDQLRLAVTAPQLLVAQRVRAAVRDAVLGRDDAPTR